MCLDNNFIFEGSFEEREKKNYKCNLISILIIMGNGSLAKKWNQSESCYKRSKEFKVRRRSSIISLSGGVGAG